MKRKLKVNDFFCGCGGMGIAFKNAGYEIAGAWDFDKYAVESYRANVGDHVQKADIKELHQADIPQADVWAFGFPCQDLSVAGKQTGLDGSRSGLFMEAVRITREMREKTNGQYPKYIIWENVAGAFSSNKGEDFRRVLEEITQSNISMPKSGKWATAGMVGNEGPGGGRSVYRMAIA